MESADSSGIKQGLIEHLAWLVVGNERRGTLDGWRDYLRDRQLKAGISNAEMAKALEIERRKHGTQYESIR